MDAGLALIAWKGAIEGPVSDWGQLVAFLSGTHRAPYQDSGAVISLLHPQLRRKKQVHQARAMFGEMKSRTGVSFPQLRDEARSE